MESNYDDYQRGLSEAAANLSKSSPLSYAEAIKLLSEARAQIGQPQPGRMGPDPIEAARAFINGRVAMENYNQSMFINASLPTTPLWAFPRVEKESTPGSPPPLNRDGPDQWFLDLINQNTISKEPRQKAQPPIPVEEPLPSPVAVRYKRLIRE